MEKYIDKLKDSFKEIDISEKIHCFKNINVNYIVDSETNKKCLLEGLKLFQICVDICKDNKWLDYIEPNLVIPLKTAEKVKSLKPFIPKTIEDIVKDLKRDFTIELCLFSRNNYNFICGETYNYNCISTNIFSEYMETSNLGITYNANKTRGGIKDGEWFYYREIDIFYNEDISNWDINCWKI